MIGELSQNVGHGDAKATNAGLARHDGWIDGDAFQVHHCTLYQVLANLQRARGPDARLSDRSRPENLDPAKLPTPFVNARPCSAAHAEVISSPKASRSETKTMRNVHLASVDLNLLVILDEVLRSQSTVEAAKRLGKTQSSISHALGKLREVLGDPLFVRVGNGLRPTTFALDLEGPLRETLVALERVILQKGSVDPARLERTFTISAADFAEVVVIPRLLQRLRREAPGVDLTVRFTGSDQARVTQSGEIDLALGTNFDPLSGLVTQRLFVDPFVCAVRRDNPLFGERVTLDEYVAADHVLVIPRGTPGSVVDDALEPLGRQRRIVFRTPHFMGAVMAVAQSDLVITLPRCFVREACRLLPLRMLQPPIEVRPFSLAYAYAANRQKDPAHAWFRRCIVEVCREIEAET